MRCVFILGASGTGKTELVRTLLGFPRVTVVKGRWTAGDGLVAAGPYVGAVLDGPDALPPAAAVLRAMVRDVGALVQGALVLFDGVRFGEAHAHELRAAGHEVVAVLLEAPPELCAGRRANRGSAPMGASWYRGQARSAEDVATRIGRVRRVDASRPARDVVADVRRLLGRASW